MTHYPYPSYIPTYQPTYYVATQTAPQQQLHLLPLQHQPSYNNTMYHTPTHTSNIQTNTNTNPLNHNIHNNASHPLLPDLSDNSSIISNLKQLSNSVQQSTRKNTVCSYWLRGQCNRADLCKYAHTAILPTLQQQNNQHHEQNNSNQNHSHDHNVRLVKHQCSNPEGTVFPPGQRPYKTKLCNNYENNNSCPRGVACTYAHKQSELICKFCGYNYYTSTDKSNEITVPYSVLNTPQHGKKQQYNQDDRTDNNDKLRTHNNSNNSSNHSCNNNNTPYKLTTLYRNHHFSTPSSPAVLSRQTTRSDTITTRHTPSRSRAFSESLTYNDDSMARRFSNATSVFHDIHYINTQQINIEFSDLNINDALKESDTVLRYELQPALESHSINILNNNYIDLPDILYCSTTQQVDELVQQYIMHDNHNSHNSTNCISIAVYRVNNQQLISLCYKHIIIVFNTTVDATLPQSLHELLQSTQYVKTVSNTVHIELILNNHNVQCNNVIDINATLQLLCNASTTYDVNQLFDRYLNVKLQQPNNTNTITGRELQFVASESYFINSLCTVLQTRFYTVTSRR